MLHSESKLIISLKFIQHVNYTCDMVPNSKLLSLRNETESIRVTQCYSHEMKRYKHR